METKGEEDSPGPSTGVSGSPVLYHALEVLNDFFLLSSSFRPALLQATPADFSSPG